MKKASANDIKFVKFPDGSKWWHLNGELHREDGPAYEATDGSKHWWLNGRRHRVGGPAIEYAGGEKHWFLNGKWHREDGPAVELTDGDKWWYLNGEFLFELPPESQPFVFLEEFMDEEGKKQIKVLNQQGIKIWPDLPGLKQLAANWEATNPCK